jgi:hypothetical protein
MRIAIARLRLVLRVGAGSCHEVGYPPVINDGNDPRPKVPHCTTPTSAAIWIRISHPLEPATCVPNSTDRRIGCQAPSCSHRALGKPEVPQCTDAHGARLSPKTQTPGRRFFSRQRPPLPPRYQGSTIGAGGLNCRVRNENGYGPCGDFLTCGPRAGDDSRHARTASPTPAHHGGLATG